MYHDNLSTPKYLSTLRFFTLLFELFSETIFFIVIEEQLKQFSPNLFAEIFFRLFMAIELEVNQKIFLS